MHNNPIIPSQFVGNIIFSSLNYLCTLEKFNWPCVHISLFLDSIPLVYLSICVLISYCLVTIASLVYAGKYTGVSRASLVTGSVKNLPAMRKTWVQSLGQEEPLEEEMATHSSILAWRITMDRGAQSMGSQRVGCNWATKHSTIALAYVLKSSPINPQFSSLSKLFWLF